MHLVNFNLQFFAEPDTGANGAGTGEQTTPAGAGTQQTSAPAFDYDKLAGLINGKKTATEDTVLKSYFKQQGLSSEEVTQAITQFKAEKAKNTPDVNAMQTQLTQAQAMAQQALVEKDATIEALSLGLDSKTIPYVLKLADLSNVVSEDGKTNSENLKKAINKVLEDVPQLKPSTQQNAGFQIGSGGTGQNNNATEAALKQAFGL